MQSTRPMARFRQLFRDQRGATAIEYGLIMSLVFLAVMGGVAALGDSVRGRWGDISTKVTGA